MYVKYNSSGRNKPKYKYMQCENVPKFNLSIKKMFDCEFLPPTIESLGPTRFLDGYM